MTQWTHKYGFSLETLPERIAVTQGASQFTIGIPLEISSNENRVAIVPHSVKPLVMQGHRVVVQTGAGLRSNYDDHEYSEAGAEIVMSKQEVFKSDILLKVAPPTIDEIELLHPDQCLISPLQLPTLSESYVDRLLRHRVTAVAMEYLQAADGSYPLVRTMSEIAGITAIQTAAELLCRSEFGRGVLLGGVSGVPPAKVVILGAGVVGEFAIRTALALGATVRVFDDNVYKLMRIQQIIGRRLYTSTINPVQLQYQLLSADVVIGAVHSPTGRSTILVPEEMIMKMKEGSVIIDVSIDQGGIFETSEVTSMDNPTFIKHGVIHYCVPNIASKVSRTASAAISNIITPLLIKAGNYGGIEALLHDHGGFRHGVYAYKGHLTNEYLSKRFGHKYTALDLILPSKL
ncbi:MAG: alanine dehydrogenase [Saprospiraceae bacterium]|nr:alanine dehydrogenase [Candidatus Opimibacter skivensis]MBL0006633.1 alanine dehydrogenase [Candidatus Opimibacter skivensis]MBP6681498.1 alanine dehydrogenase [Saprospiraceae bacterium]MBP8086707.1 alanine dehydrogenase [Saprospiraceae bacterium]